MSQHQYVYLRGEIELHYVGEAPASQPSVGQDTRYKLRPTLERRTNSRARLRHARILSGPYDPAQLRAVRHLEAGAVAAVQVELAAGEAGAGDVFREDLVDVYVTDVTLLDVMHQGSNIYGTLKGTGYATLVVPAEPVAAPVSTDLTSNPITVTGWRRWLPTPTSTSTTTPLIHEGWPDWLSLGRVLRYFFLGWLALSLFGSGWLGLGLLGLLLYWFLAPVLPTWLGLGNLLRYGLGILLVLAGITLGLKHQWLAALLSGGLGLLLLLGGGRAATAVVGTVVGGLRLVLGLAAVAALALLALSWLSHQPWPDSTSTNEAAEATGQLSTNRPPTTQPPADSLLMSHFRRWHDLTDNQYEGRLAIAQNQYFRARQAREAIPSRDGIAESEDVSENQLYAALARTDADRLPQVYALFDSLGRARGLNREQFAQMVVTCVQDIPYALVHQGTCDEFDQRVPNMASQHDRRTCQPGIRFGVQAPAEFLYNLKADCDTRAVFLYTVLRHFGYDAAVLVSDHYSHAVLGLAQPAASRDYVERAGHRYYAWETTAKGFPLGMLAPQMADMQYWDVAVASR